MPISLKRLQLHLPGLIYKKHSTVVLGYRHAESMRSVNYFFLRCILHATPRLCKLVKILLAFYLPTALFGFTGGLRDWNLAFGPSRIMVINASKAWGNDSFRQF